MPTATTVPRQLPAPDVPWWDPQTGKPTPEFYAYLKQIDTLVRALRLEIP